eukprot:TRINITY_DN47949_c0_g1_i1.p1 TRINITY_DN47949_c0_g1~~TRINITY_DN47949_c0_g1_i1.p1  ORF type:complete len:538 (+),score=123.64 TRINITY_DN47949_c0_g1_i1:105-1718(+)
MSTCTTQPSAEYAEGRGLRPLHLEQGILPVQQAISPTSAALHLRRRLPDPEELWPEPPRWEDQLKQGWSKRPNFHKMAQAQALQRPPQRRAGEASSTASNSASDAQRLLCEAREKSKDLQRIKGLADFADVSATEAPTNLSEPEPQPGPGRFIKEVAVGSDSVLDDLVEAESDVREALVRRLETQVALLSGELECIRDEDVQRRHQLVHAEATAQRLAEEKRVLERLIVGFASGNSTAEPAAVASTRPATAPLAEPKPRRERHAPVARRSDSTDEATDAVSLSASISSCSRSASPAELGSPCPQQHLAEEQRQAGQWKQERLLPPSQKAQSSSRQITPLPANTQRRVSPLRRPPLPPSPHGPQVQQSPMAIAGASSSQASPQLQKLPARSGRAIYRKREEPEEDASRASSPRTTAGMSPALSSQSPSGRRRQDPNRMLCRVVLGAVSRPKFQDDDEASSGQPTEEERKQAESQEGRAPLKLQSENDDLDLRLRLAIALSGAAKSNAIFNHFSQSGDPIPHVSSEPPRNDHEDVELRS